MRRDAIEASQHELIERNPNSNFANLLHKSRFDSVETQSPLLSTGRQAIVRLRGSHETEYNDAVIRGEGSRFRKKTKRLASHSPRLETSHTPALSRRRTRKTDSSPQLPSLSWKVQYRKKRFLSPLCSTKKNQSNTKEVTFLHGGFPKEGRSILSI